VKTKSAHPLLVGHKKIQQLNVAAKFFLGDHVRIGQSLHFLEQLFEFSPHYGFALSKNRIFGEIFQQRPILDARLAATLKVVKVLAVRAALFEWRMDEQTFVTLAQNFPFFDQAPCPKTIPNRKI
jgi:hypothetical protein